MDGWYDGLFELRGITADLSAIPGLCCQGYIMNHGRCGKTACILTVERQGRKCSTGSFHQSAAQTDRSTDFTRCIAASDGKNGLQKIDNSVSVVNCSRARIPFQELPLGFNFGLQTATENFPGCTATMPPPTPLLPGNPVRKANSPASS